ncbi:hypothetical protein WJX73_009183 [Symbiochloris irregularis]|uniref:Uncharacterized protein n=1 Tax=Symbiochloris irregularis TaxID=706552 RepID=A0AAW1NZ65_9CHLO
MGELAPHKLSLFSRCTGPPTSALQTRFLADLPHEYLVAFGADHATVVLQLVSIVQGSSALQDAHCRLPVQTVIDITTPGSASTPHVGAVAFSQQDDPLILAACLAGSIAVYSLQRCIEHLLEEEPSRPATHPWQWLQGQTSR